MRNRPKIISVTLAWWKKLKALAHAEHRNINEQAEALWSEALKHREQVKEFAQEHLKDASKD